MMVPVNNRVYLKISYGRHSTSPISSTLRSMGKQRFEKQTIFRVIKLNSWTPSGLLFLMKYLSEIQITSYKYIILLRKNV